jgi:hypothetical protein
MDTPDFGRYEILAELARGACGVIYRARDRELGREVALKTPRRGEDSLVARERFLREARLAARLEHPGIIPVLDAGVHEDRPYYVMPLLDGGPLRGPVPPAEACRLVRLVAEALAFAHERGVIHRDLKPANVLLLEGRPVLTDFGVARGESDVRVTEAGELVGTPAYMAPEVMEGRAREAGPAADLWSLGVIFYELLAGRLPFEGDSFLELSARALNGTAPGLRGFDPDLAGLVARCLARDPAERPGARELAARLSRWGRPARPRRSVPPALALLSAAALAAWPATREPLPAGDMVRLPAGRYALGDPRLGRRSVDLDAFWIDREEAPRRASGWSFLEAAAWCLKRDKRLPTEEEWEAAAGATLFPWGTEPVPAACAGVAGGNARDVSPAGCRDMAGGLAEWTATPGAAGNDARVVRGGSREETPRQCSTWERRELPAGSRRSFLGFRCARRAD